jgi:hypothetical protein
LGGSDLGGVVFGIDGGLRFARNWYLAGVFEHAELSDASEKGSATALGVQIADITNPDRVSFYLSGGAEVRWYANRGSTLSGGQALFGVGIWIPIGSGFRLLPEVTAAIGSLSGTGLNFFMLGLAGFYNLDF